MSKTTPAEEINITGRAAIQDSVNLVDCGRLSNGYDLELGEACLMRRPTKIFDFRTSAKRVSRSPPE